jgi:exopolysaccharide biosynthesis polyprenyl glycosylphosphotransferase
MALNVAEHLMRADGSQYQVIGCLDHGHEAAASGGAVPMLGTLDQAGSVARNYHIDELLIALPLGESDELAGLMSAIQELPIQVKVVPDYFDLAYLYARSDEIAGIPVIRLKDPVLNARQRAVKRVFDLLVAGVLLLASAPILLVAAVVIRLDSVGPAFYRQRRVGENGRPFAMYKLRTMIVDADKQERALVQSNGDALQFNKAPDDPRVTRVGAFLRRWSIDELPQLWNVIKGDMSLVGPRPELPSLVERYSAWQRKRFAVPQGVTGWWQVNGRPQSVDEKVELDLYYARHYSVWLDTQILIRTVAAVASRNGAY